MHISKNILIVTLSCILGLGVLFSFTQKEITDLNHEDGTYVTMLSTEVHGKNTKGSEIEICYDNDVTERIKLKEYSSENREANLITITKTLNEVRRKGYKLINSSVAVTQFHKTELFIFEKK